MDVDAGAIPQLAQIAIQIRHYCPTCGLPEGSRVLPVSRVERAGEVASSQADAGGDHLDWQARGGEQFRRIMQANLLHESHRTAPKRGYERTREARPAHARNPSEARDAVVGSGMVKHVEDRTSQAPVANIPGNAVQRQQLVQILANDEGQTHFHESAGQGLRAERWSGNLAA